MALRALLLAAWIVSDISPIGVDPVLPVEKLGNSFQSKGAEEDNGLKVSVWVNLRLERNERWHRTEKDEWFIRVRPGIFVLTVHDPKEGGWITCPAERIVWRHKAWRRITLKR